MKILTLTIIVVFVVFLIPSNSYASTCAVKETIYSAPQFFLLSDSVFAGTVTSITDYGNHQWQVHFDMEKTWKGVATRQTSTVMTNTLQGCGYSINVGDKYLIYTNGSPPVINTVYSKLYSDAQDGIALFDDPKFQSQEQSKEDLNKNLEYAQGRVQSMMMDKSSHIPIVGVGVDQVNSTLDIMIDDQKATLSVEQYVQNLKDILGDIPVKVEFGHPTALMPIIPSTDTNRTTSYSVIHGTNSSKAQSPLEQLRFGVDPHNVVCRQDLQLVIKSEDSSPACVKPDTAQKLIDLGWATSTTDLKPWVKIDTHDLNNTYVVNQPISFSVTVKGFGNYPCVSPQIEIRDNKNPSMSVFKDNRSTMSCPALRTSDNYSFDFPGKNSHYVIILNKTGDYTMTVSYGENSVQKYFSVVLPSDQKNLTILENGVGIILLKNQTYYFYTPNYTDDVYTHPVEVSFHDVIFTLFPSGFRGGLPTSCGSQYYWTDAKFSDDTSERLHIFAGSQCHVLPLPTYFSNHANPQAGLTFYDGKMKLLVSADVTNSSGN